jgi:hypothetical protein
VSLEPRTCGERGYVDGGWSAKRVDLRPGGLAGRADGEVDEVGVGSCAVPVLLAGRDVDDVAGLDEVLLPVRGEDAAALGAVEDLRNVVRMEVGAGAGGEPHECDLEPVRSGDERLDAHLADEVLRFGVGGGFGRVGYAHAVSIAPYNDEGETPRLERSSLGVWARPAKRPAWRWSCCSRPCSGSWRWSARCPA